MSTPEKQLSERIRELRRRHFGARGKAEFARRLNAPIEDYERYERGAIPSGELLVRMCELTGEDLQWLLTGAASRGAVVISGARNRHQKLLAHIASELDSQPALATPLEAFFELLLTGAALNKDAPPALPASNALIPIFGPRDWPQTPPDPDGPDGGRALLAPPTEEALASCARVPLALSEPNADGGIAAGAPASLLALSNSAAPLRDFIHCPDVVHCFPLAFGVRIDNEKMAPIFSTGDVAIVAAGAEPRLGAPALCKFADPNDDRCRIWLGEEGDHVNLGRASDGGREQASRDTLLWSLDVIYRAAQAA